MCAVFALAKESISMKESCIWYRPLRRGLDRELAAFIAAGTTDLPKRALRDLAADIKAHGETPFLADPKTWLDGTRTRRK